MRTGLAWLEQGAGALLTALVLLDVFLTVLYARMGHGIISGRLARVTWRLSCWATRPLGGRRGALLSYCGPIILVLLVGTWSLALTLGGALILHPALGGAVVATSGATRADFASALYAAAGSIAVVSASDFTPRTDGFRLIYVFNSIVGMSTLTLTLTYLLQIYTALLRRNVLGLKLHLGAAERADGAEWLAALGPGDRFDGGYMLAEAAAEMAHVRESHHFYPVLFYFRFTAPLYSVSRFTLIALDTITLLQSALSDERHRRLKESAPVLQLERASRLMLSSLLRNFLPARAEEACEPPDAAAVERWRGRYRRALDRLRRAGITPIEDERAGEARYVELRAGWDGLVRTLAPYMSYSMDEIDPASCPSPPPSRGDEAV